MRNRNIFAFLGIMITSVFIWLLVFTTINKTPKDKMLNFFVVGTVEVEKINSYLLPSLKEDNVEKITYTQTSINSEEYYMLFSTQGVFDSDLFVLPKSELDAFEDYSIFLEINNEELANPLNYLNNSITYGIYYSNTRRYFGFENNEEYYLLINANSVNAGKKTTNAIKALNLLLL